MRWIKNIKRDFGSVRDKKGECLWGNDNVKKCVPSKREGISGGVCVRQDISVFVSVSVCVREREKEGFSLCA